MLIVKTIIPDDGFEEAKDYAELPLAEMEKFCKDNPDKEIGFQVIDVDGEEFYGMYEMEIYQNNGGELEHLGRFVFESAGFGGDINW